MTTRHIDRQFPLISEAELLVWCARTEVSDDLKTRIRQRLQAPLNWEVVRNMAQYHGVVPLLYRNLSAIAPDLVSSEMLGRLRRLTQAGQLLNRELAKELVVLSEVFTTSSVPVVPIKGATLAVSAYGDLALRDFSDLDLLVPESSIAEAQAVLLAQGYEGGAASREPSNIHHDEGPYHVFRKKGTLSRVDLQWVMAHEHFAFRLDRPEFWKRSSPVDFEGKTIRCLSPDDLLIVLCVHGSKHAWGLLKWVCDVAELLRSHPNLDWDRCFRSATNFRCRRMLEMGLSLAHLVLDAPLPERVVATLAADPDVHALSHRMPARLLAKREEGITEEQAGALYFSLKDSFWDRWWCGFLLCWAHSHVATTPPSWFRWCRSLPFLASVIIPAHRAIQYILPPAIRGAISRWVAYGG